MPSIEQNLRAWELEHDWSQQGDDWSAAWGGPKAQWFGTIYPRIHNFVPASRILEIAPGFGRWTQFLKCYCESLTVVDLTAACIESCKRRFQADAHITYHVNDGRSLEMIADKSVDFAFSFDSLVHAEADVIEAYVNQLARKLSNNGVGFIHHSNLGSYVDFAGKLSIENSNWRAPSMTGKLFEQFCNRAGLQCMTQELADWGESKTAWWRQLPGVRRLVAALGRGGMEPRSKNVPVLTECFSLFTPKSSIWARPNVLIANKKLMGEAQYIRRLSAGYVFATSNEKPLEKC